MPVSTVPVRNAVLDAKVVSSDNTAQCDNATPNLKAVDPEMHMLVHREEMRQKRAISLIASENFTSKAVMEVLGSRLTNKYAEGQPGARYYGGSEVVDRIENLCKARALEAFDLDRNVWAVNVQPYSGSPANFAAFHALLSPHDRIMGLALPCGGHLTHGFYTPKRKVSATSVYFESLPYKVDPASGLIDFTELRKMALVYRPKLIIAGISAYPRDLQLDKFREIADAAGAYLMCDMAHISGLVAGKQVKTNPFEYADIVTSTTHKVLRGPRCGIIFVNTNRIPNGREKVDQAVFPGLQGGPHMNQIGALAVQLKELKTPEWKEYTALVVRNAQSLAEYLTETGFTIVTGGTDNHMLLVDLRPLDVTGSEFEGVATTAELVLNKNTIPGDVSAMHPSGIRVGSAAMTTRGVAQQGWRQIAQWLWRVVTIIQAMKAARSDPKVAIPTAEVLVLARESSSVQELRAEVNAFAEALSLP